MDMSDCLLKIGDASFRWEDESPMRKRNRLAQREYRKRKRHTVRLAKDPDSMTESPPPTRPILERCDRRPDLSSPAQQSASVCDLQFFLTQTSQATSGEDLNTGQFYDDTSNVGSVYPYEEARYCLSAINSPDISHAHATFEGFHEARHPDLKTRGHPWSNEQCLTTPSTEEPAVPQAFMNFPVGAVSPPTSPPSALSPCIPDGFLNSRENWMGGSDSGMGRCPIDHIATTPANLEERFEMILDACKVAGYDSIDSMVAEYYTASFPPSSYLAAAQSLSRSRDLPELLDNLYAASPGWDQERQNPHAFNEAEKFREKILRLATSILSDEAGQMERARIRPQMLHPPGASEGNGQVSSGDSPTSRR